MTVTAVPQAPSSKWLVLITAVFGVFLSLLDATSIKTALPTLQRLFHTDLRPISPVATTSQVAAGVTVCTAVSFARRFSLKRSYLMALTALLLPLAVFLPLSLSAQQHRAIVPAREV